MPSLEPASAHYGIASSLFVFRTPVARRLGGLPHRIYVIQDIAILGNQRVLKAIYGSNLTLLATGFEFWIAEGARFGGRSCCALGCGHVSSFHGSISSCHVGVDVILHSNADSIIHIATTR